MEKIYLHYRDKTTFDAFHNTDLNHDSISGKRSAQMSETLSACRTIAQILKMYYVIP